jgi:hypothetical protein
MEWIIGACTILGGAAAVWFFWDKLSGKADTKQGAVIEDAQSRGGSITASDQTGHGATIRRVEAQNDISASSTQDSPLAPKEPPQHQ